MKYKIYAFVILAFVAFSAVAAQIDTAKKHYREGQYETALKELQSILKRTPKDGTANYYLGMTYIALGRVDEAISPLKKAEGRGVVQASSQLAQIAIDRYDIESATDHLDKWQKELEKKKKSIPEEHAQISSRLVKMRNMMERVEKIEIIDSLAVDSLTFFTAYKLSKEAGRILSPENTKIMCGTTENQIVSVAYMPENNSEVLWSATNDEGIMCLWSADILDDGTLSEPKALPQMLSDGGNAVFPFLMPDGMTLYFANDGANSIGGYDIFMTRRSSDNEENSYFQAQNIGMPYNSIYNDYMFAIDEHSGLGWFATDRNHIPGKITIYIFAPSSVRINADSTDPNIAALARLSNISLTRNEGVDYAELLAERLPEDLDDYSSSSPKFKIDLGTGKIYTTLEDFRSAEAQKAMLEYLSLQAKLRKHLQKEEQLRLKYSRGDKSIAEDIMMSEEETAQMYSELSIIRNKVASYELK